MIKGSAQLVDPIIPKLHLRNETWRTKNSHSLKKNHRFSKASILVILPFYPVVKKQKIRLTKHETSEH